MRSFNHTIKHYSDHPADDRPEYLINTPYTIAFDTETNGLDWFDGGRAFIATVSDYDRDYLYILEDHPTDPTRKAYDDRDKHSSEGLRYALLNSDVLLAHNFAFDAHILVAQGIVTLDELLGKTKHDTEQLARVIIPKWDVPNYRLKTLASMLVDADAKDAENEVLDCMVSLGLIKKRDQKERPPGSYYEVWKHYPDVLERYALYDTRCTYDLYHVLVDKMNDNHRRVYYNIECPVLDTFVRMEDAGVQVDQVRARDLKVEYEERRVTQQAELNAFAAGEQVDPNKKGDLLPLFEAAGIELTDLTDDGELRLDKWVLNKHAAETPEAGPLVDAILGLRATEKFLSTYIDRVVDRAVVHPSFIQNGAWTGRASCMNPNMQNIPVRTGPEARSMFVPEPGHALIVADFSSIEPRILDLYMGPSALTDEILSGQMYYYIGEWIFGTRDPSGWPVPYQPMKNGTLAMFYGAGGPKFADTVGGGLTAADGRALIKEIKNALGKPFKDLQYRIRQRIKTVGYVVTLGGRQQWVPRDKAYVGLNSLMQGSAADCMKLAMIRAEPVVADLGGKLILTVHDELVASVPVGIADLALRKMQDAMESVADLDPKGRLALPTSGVVCHNHYGEAKG